MRVGLIQTLLLVLLITGGAEAPAVGVDTGGVVAWQRVLPIATFDPGEPERAYGELEETCPPTARDVVALTVQPAERCGREGGCLEIHYAFKESATVPAGLRIALQRLDASRFDHLSFWVKGDAQSGFEPQVRVGFKRPDPGRAGLVESASTVVSGVTGAWQHVLVPLGQMTGIRQWTDLGSFFVVIDPRRAIREEGGFFIDDIALVATGKPGPRADDPVVAARKRAWEESLGGRQAALPAVRARLRGWPERVLVEPPHAGQTDEEFLFEVARDTWRGIDALTDRANGLPLDHVRFGDSSSEPAAAEIGDYTSPTNIGLHLIAIVAAHELGLLSTDAALERLRTLLRTVERLEPFEGFLFNFYDTVSLERTSNFVSFVDSAWLTAGLIVARQAFPSLSEACTRLIERGSYRLFYDDTWELMSHGYYVNLSAPSEYHYGVLYAESRIGSLIAIGKGEVPEAHWFRMKRIFPAACVWQSQRPIETGQKHVRGYTFRGGYYEWNRRRYVPSWGGSMFEALMPTLVLDEQALAAESLGRNDAAHVTVQREYATGQLGYPVWGMSPSTSPQGGYGEYGVDVLGSRGYAAGAVSPHAAALALGIDPGAAVANLRTMVRLYPMYGEYGLYDAVDPRSGAVAHAYLALDQSMILISIANRLKDHCVQRYFAGDPIVRAALPIIADERFFD